MGADGLWGPREGPHVPGPMRAYEVCYFVIQVNKTLVLLPSSWRPHSRPRDPVETGIRSCHSAASHVPLGSHFTQKKDRVFTMAPKALLDRTHARLLPLQPLLLFSTPLAPSTWTTPVFLLGLGHTKPIPSSGPLHLLSLLPGILFPQISSRHPPSSSTNLCLEVIFSRRLTLTATF